MNHNENIRSAIAREMKEEVNLEGDFTYNIISIDEPTYLREHDFWQVRLIYEIKPENNLFSAGEDSDKIAFISPDALKDSSSQVERRIYDYANIL